MDGFWSKKIDLTVAQLSLRGKNVTKIVKQLCDKKVTILKGVAA